MQCKVLAAIHCKFVPSTITISEILDFFLFIRTYIFCDVDQPNEDRTSSYHQSPEHQHYRRGPEQNIGKCHSRGNYHGQSDRRHFVGLPYTHDLRQSLYQARKGQWLQGRQSYKKVKNVSIFDRLGSRRESVFDRLGNCKHGQKQ